MPLGSLLRRPTLSTGGVTDWLRPPPEEEDPVEVGRRLFGIAAIADDPVDVGNKLFAQFQPPPPPPPVEPQPPPFDLGVGPVSTLDRFGYQPRVELQPPPPRPLMPGELRPGERINPKTGSVMNAPPPLGEGILDQTWGAVKGGFDLGRAGAHAITSAYGEEFGALPGHENEPKDNVFGVPVGRLQAHAKKLWQTGGADMHPQDPAVMAKSDAVWHFTPAQRDLYKRRGRPDPGEYYTPTANERTADEVARGVVNLAYNILTDPSTHAIAGITGIPAKLLGAAFATDGIKHSAQTLNDPNASDADKVLSLIQATMASAPVVAHAVVHHGPTIAKAAAAAGEAVGKTAATAGAGVAMPAAKLMRETILAAKLRLPNITAAAPSAFGAGTRAPMTAMERIGGSELPGNLPGTPMTKGEIFRGPFEERLSTAPRNEAKPPPVVVPEAFTTGTVVETPSGVGRIAKVETPPNGIPKVTVQLPDGTHEAFRPDVLKPVSPPEAKGVLLPPVAAEVPPLTQPPAPEPLQPGLGLAAAAAPRMAVLPKEHGELRADTLEKAHELQREQTAATGLPHAVIEAPGGFIVSAGRLETPSANPPAKPDESISDYQRRTRVGFQVAQEMVNAARAAAPPVVPAPRVVAPPPTAANAAVEEQPSLFGDEPAAPPAAAAAPTADVLYTPRHRPPSTAALPRAPWSLVERPSQAQGFDKRTDLPVSAHPFGVVKFDRPLTPQEVEDFELDPVAAPAAAVEAAAPAPAPAAPLTHTVKRSPDFRESGNYHLTFSDGRTYPIYRDSGDLKMWLVDGIDAPQTRAFTQKELIGQLAKLDESGPNVNIYSGRREGTLRETLDGLRQRHGLTPLGPLATIEAPGQGAPSGREANLRGPGSDTGATAPAVPAPAGPGDAGATAQVAPDVQSRIDRAQAIVNAITAHPKFAGYSVSTTPEGHLAFHAPDATTPPVLGHIVPTGSMPSPFASENALASFLTEANTSGTGYYTMGRHRHPLPTTVKEFNALPKGHRDKLRTRFVVAGRYDPATDTIHISDDWSHDPDVWGEEHFHAGIERLTPQEKIDAGVETKAKEEAAYRAGYRVPPEIYSRQRGNLGTLGKEGTHGRQETEARADAGAPDVEGSDRAVREADRQAPDARGAGAAEAEAGRAGREAPSVAVRRSPSTVQDDFERLLADVREPDGGFTYSPISGSPTHGFALSVTKGAEAKFDPKTFSFEDLLGYVEQHNDAWDDPLNYIGAWHNPDDGVLYLDISTVVNTPEEAERLGYEHEQLAYFNLDPAVRKSIPREEWTTPAPSYAVREYAPVEKIASLERMNREAQKGTFKTRRDLKIHIEDRVRRAAAAAGVNLTPATGKGKKYEVDPDVRTYLVRMGIKDALFALQANKDAVGWYDTKVSQALAVLSLIHPEIAKDANARFAFTFALAATSNGIQVSKNFELAEGAYEHFKRTGGVKRNGQMPTDIGEGTAATQINGALKDFNELSAKWGMDDFRKFMLSQFTVGEIKRLGFDVTGEPVDLLARGAVIVGAKIGNGFFSNLNGHFDALTMDRWLMRTWGRWSGQLFKENAAKVEENRGRTRRAIDAIISRSPEAAKEFGDLIGIDLSKATPSTTPWTPAMNVRGEPSEGETSLDRIAHAIMKSSEKPENRKIMNALDPGPEGSELRRAGNIHAKNIDAQKEAPASGSERTLLRGVFGDVLKKVRAKGYPALTMADLQALLWYPEKRLYDKAKTQDDVAEGYEPDEAPDYANAARDLARSNGIGDRAINDALDRGARHRTGSSRLTGSGDESATFTPAERQAFLDRWKAPPKPKKTKAKADDADADADADAADKEQPDVAPSYAIRSDTLTLDKLQREATKQGVSLADAVAQARIDGRDIDVSDYFNLKRVELPDDEQQALEDQIIDTAVATGRVPKERMSEADIRAEAQQLGGDNLAKQLDPYLKMQLPMRAVRDAARHRINELSREIYTETKALAALPIEQKAEREAAEDTIAEKQATIQQLLNMWMRIRSEDGRNLAMHRMMSDSVGWQWGDKSYWFARAKRELGLPQGAELPPDVLEKLNDILERGKEASGTDEDEDVEEVEDAPPDVTAAPQGAAAGEPGGQAGGAGAASTGQPDESGGDVTGESGGASRGRMTTRPRVEGPVLPPLPSRGGSLTRGPQVEGPVLPPTPSRGRMTAAPPVQGPVLPPVESRGRMTSRPPVEGPVLPPKEGQQGGPRTSKPRGPAPFRLTPPPGDPKPPANKMHGPPLSYPERKRDRKPRPKEAAVQLELADYLTGLKKTPWLEAIMLLRKAGLLTGLPTHARNFVGNLGFQIQEEAGRVGAAIPDMLIALGTGKRTVEGANLMAMLRAGNYARTTGWQQAKQTMRGGALTAAEKLKLGAHRELNTGTPADTYGNFVFRSLTASDRVFKAYALMRSLEAQAAVMAKNSKGAENKKDILANPTPVMMARAKTYAEYATFNNKNVAASMWQHALNLGKDHGGLGGKIIATGLDTIVPFTNTPANIFERILDGTPLLMVPKMGVAAYRGWQNSKGGGGGEPPPDKGTWRQKKPTQKAVDKKAKAAALAKELSPSQQEAFSLAFGRGLPGMALMALGAWLAKKGLATGTTDSDEGKRNVQEAAGLQPGSIKFGNEWRRVDGFAPWGTMISLGASLYEHGFTMTNIATASSHLATEQPMLQGTQEALRGIDRWDTAGQRWLSNTIGSAVPSVVSNVGADLDPYRRESRPEGDVLTRGTQARTPWWREKLPPRTDVFGRSMKEASLRSLDPTTPMQDRNDAVTRALLRLHVGIGKPDKVPASVETDAQYRQRVVATGQAIRIELENAVRQPGFSRMSDELQTEALEDAIAAGRKQVPRPTPRKR